jgi:hypothetical protein
MKKFTSPKNTILALGFSLAAFVPAVAQTAYQYLDGTNVSALFNADGLCFWDGKNAHFEAPKGSGKNTISGADLWIGGLDVQGHLHIAAQTYHETGRDFWPGPLRLSDGSTDVTLSSKYNKVWKVTRLQIDSFRAGLSTPAAILDWPGNSDQADGVSAKLAPFIDLNGNGIYEPSKGEYPDIKGDVMLWWVFNDNLGGHGESFGLPLGIEIQASAYTYNCSDPILSNAVFLDYKIFNRSGNTYNNVYAGMWSDLDIGNIFNDYAGSIPELNTYYGYNATTTDKDTTVSLKSGSYLYRGYGNMLPAQGITFLKGISGDNGKEMPMSSFMTYNNDRTATGDPFNTTAFYNYLRGRWADGSPLTAGGTGYGGSDNTSFAFSGNVLDKKQWSEQSAGTTPGDRRGIGSFGPFTLAAGASKEMELAFTFHLSPSGKALLSADLLRNDTKALVSMYQHHALAPCTGISTCTKGDSCVWPGDANDDGIANMQDLLRIGLAYGETGPIRPFASNSWVGQNAAAWSKSFKDGVNFRHADCNGDGKVDSADVIPLWTNYSSTHGKTSLDVEQTTATPVIRIVFDQDSVQKGDVLSGTIYIGDSAIPANNILAVLFSLGFDPSVFDASSFQMDFSESQLGAVEELLAMFETYATKDHVDGGVTRNNKTGKDVKGSIGKFRLVVTGDIGGITVLKLHNVQIYDPSLALVNGTVQDAQVKIYDGIRKYYDLSAHTGLFPNPAESQLTISLDRTTDAIVNFYDLQGTPVKTIKSTATKNISTDVSAFPAGIYIVEIQTPDGRAIKKFSKLR